jgi:hypothetical protein
MAFYTLAKLPRDVILIFFPRDVKFIFVPCKPINKKKLKFEFNLKKKQLLFERAIYKRDVYKVLYTTRDAKRHLQACTVVRISKNLDKTLVDITLF